MKSATTPIASTPPRKGRSQAHVDCLLMREFYSTGAERCLTTHLRAAGGESPPTQKCCPEIAVERSTTVEFFYESLVRANVPPDALEACANVDWGALFICTGRKIGSCPRCC